MTFRTLPFRAQPSGMRFFASVAVLLTLLVGPGIACTQDRPSDTSALPDGTSPVTSEAPAFPLSLFSARRAAAMEMLGDGALIAIGSQSMNSDGPARQDPNFWYLTRMESPFAILVVVRRGDALREVVFVPEQYQFAAVNYPIPDSRFREASWNRPVLRVAPDAAGREASGIGEIYPLDEFAQRLPELVPESATVFFSRGSGTPYSLPGLARIASVPAQLEESIRSALPGRAFDDASATIRRMRLTKDSHEIAAMREAADISVEGLREAMRRTRPGMTSMELAGIMESVWKREGSPRPAFEPIVSAGTSAVKLYGLRRENYNPLEHIFADGELVFVDYGAAEIDHYASDVARTFPANGTFTAEQREYYEIVVEAERAAIAVAKPGARMIDLIRASAQVFRDHGLERFEDIGQMGPDSVWGVFPSPSFFLRSDEAIMAAQRETGLRARDLGHHVGIEVVQPADMMMPLEPGMIFTIEPKIYSPGLGAAIMVEDMILITEDGHENLSAGVPVDADEIERLMANR